jgi:D-amino-acid dehydrogenase
MADVVVVGAGAIGLCCAYSLRKRGLDVVVVDAGEPGEGASHGNGGWICPSLSGPVPAPGVTAKSLRWLLRPDSPLYIRFRADVRFLHWLWQFRRHCNERDYNRSLDAVARLNLRTLDLYDAMLQDGVQFEMHNQGLLFLFRTDAAVRSETADLRRVEQFGYPPARWLPIDELRAEEPHVAPGVLGGLLAPAERHVRPESLTRGLVDRLQEMGVPVRSHEAVVGFQIKDKAITGVRTTKGQLNATHVVLAAGVWTGGLSRMLNQRLPLEAGKGYSVTMHGAAYPIRRPLYFAETLVGCSPYEGGVRILGTMELSGINSRIPARRMAALKRAPEGYLSGWQPTQVQEEWTGMRPLTPDGLPIIGPLPGYCNAFVATGHAMLGITLGPVTGEAIADLVMETAPADALTAFRADRF